jgi:hypothetical protein
VVRAVSRDDAADRWLAEHDTKPQRARHPRSRALIETRWDQGGMFVRIWLPERTYRQRHITRVTRAEAEALVRNLSKRLAEVPAGNGDAA